MFGESTDFHFTSQTPSNTYTVVADWLPDGYVLESRQEDNTGSTYYYQKAENENFYVSYTPGDGALMSADTEDAKTRNIEINGVQALSVGKDNEQQIIWSTPDKTAFLWIVGSGIAEEDLIHVAEQLKY